MCIDFNYKLKQIALFKYYQWNMHLKCFRWFVLILSEFDLIKIFKIKHFLFMIICLQSLINYPQLNGKDHKQYSLIFNRQLIIFQKLK